jgi:hypothetical protein
MLLIIAEADARTSFASGNILQRLQSFTKYWLLNRRENNGYKGLAFRYIPI